MLSTYSITKSHHQSSETPNGVKAGKVTGKKTKTESRQVAFLEEIKHISCTNDFLKEEWPPEEQIRDSSL